MNSRNETPEFMSRTLRARFREFRIPLAAQRDCSVVVPTVKGTFLLKYGIHSYTFYNFSTLDGLEVTIPHSEIIRFKMRKLRRAQWHRNNSLISVLFKRFHYDFTFLEQLMLMTVPHTVTPVGDGRVFVNLWAYFGYIDIDLWTRTATYRLLNDPAYRRILGSQQYFDRERRERYYVTYSLGESLDRIDRVDNPVCCTIHKQRMDTGVTECVWTGSFADYVHDMVVDKDRRYCVVPELGLYTDEANRIVPSRVLILDLSTQRTWTIKRFSVAAHAQFHPDDSSIVFFSNHNFNFEHTRLLTLLKKATYTVKFKGPASIFRYRITPEGPEETGVFTRPDFFRLTNFHVFNHRNRTIIAAIGFPDMIFLIDALTMEYIKTLTVGNFRQTLRLDTRKRAVVGTISPSSDGEKLYVQTTRSFQIVDLETGEADMVINHFFIRTCANHMQTIPASDR